MRNGNSFALKSYRGREYYLFHYDKPEPGEFCVNVYYEDPDTEENVEIARVDTAHNSVHFDQLHRRDQPVKEVDWTYGEAIERLTENWRKYAETYEKNHG